MLVAGHEDERPWAERHRGADSVDLPMATVYLCGPRLELSGVVSSYTLFQPLYQDLKADPTQCLPIAAADIGGLEGVLIAPSMGGIRP